MFACARRFCRAPSGQSDLSAANIAAARDRRPQSRTSRIATIQPVVGATLLGVLLGDVIFAGGSALLFYAARVDPQAPAEVRFILISVGGGIVLAMAGGWVAGWFGRRNDLV